jgi:hypothetical protein
MKIWMNFQEVIYQRAWTVEISINHLLFQPEMEMPIHYSSEQNG